MSQAKLDLRAGRLGRNVLAALAIGLAGGWWPTASLAGPAGVLAMAVAAGVCAAGLAAGLLILLPRAQADRAKVAMTFLLTAPVRLLVTLAAAVSGWWFCGLPAAPLLIWVSIFYLLLLTAEASWLVGLLDPVASI